MSRLGQIGQRSVHSEGEWSNAHAERRACKARLASVAPDNQGPDPQKRQGLKDLGWRPRGKKKPFIPGPAKQTLGVEPRSERRERNDAEGEGGMGGKGIGVIVSGINFRQDKKAYPKRRKPAL